MQLRNFILFLLLVCVSLNSHAQDKDSLELLLKTNLSDTGRVKILNQLGYIYLNIDSAKAVNHLSEALQMARRMNYKKGMATALKNYGVLYEYSGEYKKAISFYGDALELFTDIDDKEGMADAHNNFGVIYYLQGIYDKALHSYLEAEKIYPKALNSEFYSNILNNIGLIYDKQKQFDNALHYYNDALKIRLETGNKAKISSVYNNIGLLYQGRHQLDSALLYHQLALQLREETGDIKAHGASLNNMADIYLQQGRHKDALSAFSIALQLKEKSGDKRGQSFSLLGIAETYNQMHNYPMAIEAGNKALAIARSLDLREHLVNVLSTVSETYEAQGNYKMANKLVREALLYKDSIYQQEQLLNIAEMAVRFDLEKSQLEKKELTKDVQMKDVEIASSHDAVKKQSIVILIVSLALLILIFLIFALRKTIKERDRINLELKASSQNLDESNKIKDKLFSIISHDYRGPLASVKSTLSLFEQGLISPEEEKNIVQTVQNEIDHTLNLLDNMLFWANTQLNGIEVHKESFLLTECIDTTVKLMLPQAEHKGIILQIGNSVMAQVSADKEMVTLVLRNLISNAIKFSKKSDTISIFCIQKDEWAEVHVKDTGIGMSADKKEQLFKFENAKSTYGTNNEKGVGLGLPLCRDFIHRNGGTLYISSEEGKGSDFYFTLPLA